MTLSQYLVHTIDLVVHAGSLTLFIDKTYGTEATPFIHTYTKRLHSSLVSN